MAFQAEGLSRGRTKAAWLRNRHKPGWQNRVTGIEHEDRVGKSLVL